MVIGHSFGLTPMSILTHLKTKRIRQFLPALLLGLTTFSCATSEVILPPSGDEPDVYLYNLGLKALDEKKWPIAREYFRQITDGYPQSIHRADAKLGLGDCNIGEGTDHSFTMAISEFREFLAFYPTHRKADYAQYQIAFTHFIQMRSAERDQAQTRLAIEEFNIFVERYPDSELLPEARNKLREALDRLSESEFLVGLFYYRARWYPGAIQRLRTVLRDDPDFTNRDSVYFYLAESLAMSNEETEALLFYERLLKEFKQSEYLEDAESRITELRNKTSP